MSLSKTTLGNFDLFTIETGDFKLDGGAMFGVVPKTLWSKHIPVDELNRIPMVMRCLLIKSHKTGRLYLIDSGAGTKLNAKMTDIYQLSFETKSLEKSFKEHGFTFEDVTDIIFTHLHFDHCGGTTCFDGNGAIAFTFPNARYHVTTSQWENAIEPNAREKASFMKNNIEPLANSGKLHLVQPNHEYERGLNTIMVNGHTVGQQLPIIEAGGKTLVFIADLVPTHIHVPLAWVMGYDMAPIQTLEEKDRFLKKASEQNWYLYLEHDSQEELITVGYENGRFYVNQKLTLSDI